MLSTRLRKLRFLSMWAFFGAMVMLSDSWQLQAETEKDKCILKCNEQLQEDLKACRNMAPRPGDVGGGDKRRCESQAKVNYQQCVRLKCSKLPDEGTCNKFICKGDCWDPELGLATGTSCEELAPPGPKSQEGKGCGINGCSGTLKCLDSAGGKGGSFNSCRIRDPSLPGNRLLPKENTPMGTPVGK